MMYAIRMFLVFSLVSASAVSTASAEENESFGKHAQPLLRMFCMDCHNADNMESGIRVDQLNGLLEERHLRLWENIRTQVADRVMPPEDQPQPTAAQRKALVEWINQGLNLARSRKRAKNGSVRRLTVAQYRNTLRDLLLLEDDLTDVLPPDAVSKDGFLNNGQALELSPLLVEAYFDIAERALDRCIVDENSKPAIQNFRMDLGKAINPEPCPDNLILGALSHLLRNDDFVVTQLTPEKSFDYRPFFMRTKYRFIEGYQGNATVRGWREYDSIYHSVFACMRGNGGYPKGLAYQTIPEGLLLRPAIPSAELFQVESTYGPKANFKISLRELPDHGRFRVTVKAARYDDGLLLDPGTAIAGSSTQAITVQQASATHMVNIEQAGIYQVDAHLESPVEKATTVDASRLAEELIAKWPLDGNIESQPAHEYLSGRLEGDAKFVDSPFGKAVSLDGNGDSVVVDRHELMNVGDGDFTVAAWIHPKELRQSGIFCLGKYSWMHGWYLDMPNNQGVLRIETVNTKNEPSGTVTSRPGVIRVNRWQHVAAVVRRGTNETRLFVNGYQVGIGTVAATDLDNPKVRLHIGRIQDAQQFKGDIDEVRFYRRALDDTEIDALVEPGRRFAKPPPREKPKNLTLKLGDRQFTGTLHQPAFVALRLPAGPLDVSASYPGADNLDRLVFTPLSATNDIARQFEAFEKRSPHVGVHVGLRRDCGSTLTQVGNAQTVTNSELQEFRFEGAISNFPSPDVEKDNVNYLAGIREIGVRSEYTDGRDMPRLLIRSVEFEGPLYETWPPVTHRNIFIDSASKGETIAYASEVIRSFATRAFRRPVTNAEAESLVDVWQSSFAETQDFQQSIKDALLVVLTSPQFLFLIETSETPEPEDLSPYELASKLSYFLWNEGPDQRLLMLASSGKLHESLGTEVERMIRDPRFEQFTSEFASQWLSLDKLEVVEVDRKQFPKLTRDTRTHLRNEPVEFLQYLIQQNLPVHNLIQSDFIVANEVVAGYYDLGDRTESGFAFLPVRHEYQHLGGVLTQAGILAGLSDGRESNPVKRGAWLARKIIAEPPDDPPPNVPALDEDTTHLSLRERLEKHRNQKGCAKCHSGIDPWGVPFEEFDAAGRFKKDAGIDARSTLPDKTDVENLNELRQYLANDRIDQVAFSFLKHIATYATGRTLTYNEIEFLKENGLRLRDDGYRLQDMIRFVIRSELFLEK